MATYYIDPDVTAGGAGTEGDPFKLWSEVTWAAGNTYYQKRGTTATETVTLTTNGTIGLPIVMDAYGTGDKPIIDCENTRKNGIRRVGAEYIEVNNFQVNNVYYSGVTDDKRKNAGIYFSQTATANQSCTGCKTIGCVINTAGYAGILFTPEYGETSWQVCTDALQQSCEAYDCGGIGVGMKLHTTGGVIQEYNIARRCGAVDNQWGVYNTAWGETIRTTWTDEGSNVYSHIVLNGEAKLHPILEVIATGRSTGALGDLLLTNGGDATPALNEWWWDSVNFKLYINIGQDPSVGPKSIQMLWALCDNPIMRYNIASDTAGTDGVGMGFDASIRKGRMYGNLSYNNNRGYSMHVNSASEAYGNIAYDCDEKGINCHSSLEHPDFAGEPNKVYNNTFVNTVVGVGLSNSTSIEMYNNIIVATTDVQEAGPLGNSYTDDYNDLVVTTNNMSGTNNITSDPLLTSNYKPTINSPAIAAGKIIFGARDYRGRSFHYPPNIGAYSSTSGDVAQVRTAREGW